MSDKDKTRKRIRLSEGDLFELTVPDGRLGYGVIVKRGGLKNGGAPYIAIFGSLHGERPDTSSIVADKIVLAGWTMDALVYHGRWNVIAHGVPLPRIPFPNFKVRMDGKFYVTDVEGQLIDDASASEQELLDFQFSRAPIGFQTAFEALHGFADWQDNYDRLTPAYARARVTRQAA
ncbi:MAG TPA: Imm26 family immunity protein [Sphingomicrobium sp.]|nr:Imm26 family immunity protein [Sphingomicrobium sp.]